MKLIAPSYYKKFSCLADKCPHSCCIGWKIQIDRESEERYSALCGDYSDEIRKSIHRDEDGAFFAQVDGGRCAHLDECGLCRIYKSHGEGALCDICSEHPRYYNRIGDSVAVGVGASCPMAAELILSEDLSTKTETIGRVESDLSEDYPVERLLGELSCIIESARSVSEISDLLMRKLGISSEQAVPELYRDLYISLEYLYPDNREIILSSLREAPNESTDAAKKILSYFLYRHLPDAECESDATAIALFSLLSTHIVLSMGSEDGIADALVRYSEEIEYSEDNKYAIIADISFNLI